MAQRRKNRGKYWRLFRNRSVRWSIAILGIAALVWFALAPELNRTQSPSHSQKPDSVFGRGTDSTRLQDFSAFPKSDGSRLRVVVYPYSVIPGGAQDVAELRSVVGRDPVLAEHYSGFDLSRARLVRLDDDREAYVSYRLGDHIVWSSRKLTLHKGETVITDGDHTARTRCGNLVAESPQRPVSPDEPAPEIFDMPLPVDLVTPLDPRFEVSPPEELLPNPPTLKAAPTAQTEGTYFPPVVALPPPVGGGGSWPPATPVVPTPEPGILILISSGLAGLWALRKRHKS